MLRNIHKKSLSKMYETTKNQKFCLWVLTKPGEFCMMSSTRKRIHEMTEGKTLLKLMILDIKQRLSCFYTLKSKRFHK